MPIYIGNKKVKLYLGNRKIKKVYKGNQLVYSAGNNSVTYYVDTGIVYQEEIDEGASCLSPQSFAPEKSGWEFVGWRKDPSGGDVLSSLTMGDTPITLYAVFRQEVVVTYYNGSTVASSISGYKVYNNGHGGDPGFNLTQAAISGWTARGWSIGTAGNGAISYSDGLSFTANSNITLYGMYQQTITLTYYNCSTTARSKSGMRYYNSGSGEVVNPTFSLTPETWNGWTFRGWATSSGATAAISYSSISNKAFAASTTVYGAYYQTITLSYNGNGNTGGSTAAQSGYRYYNTGNYSNPSFSLRANGFSRTSYNFSKWAMGSTDGTQYAAGASVTLTASTTFYAVWTYSGSPYYIVNNRTLVRSLSWSHVSGDTGWSARGWGEGWSGEPRIELLKRGSFTARSNAISTNGNHTLYVAFYSDGSPEVGIGGEMKTSPATFDISNLSSFYLYAKDSSNNYNAKICFTEIRLY